MENEIYLKEDIGIHKYEQAYAIIGGKNIVNVYDEEGNFVPNTTKRKFGKKEYLQSNKKKNFEDTEYDYLDEEVVYIGFMRGHWGHFMVDSSTRFWMLDRPECKGRRFLINIEGMDELYAKVFSYLGIDNEQVISLEQNTRFRAIYVPDLAYYPAKYISKEYLFPFEKIMSQINLQLPIYEKIYLSRIHFTKGKRELGEKDIQDVFKKNGCHIIYPEELSLEEQIWYYKNCKTMITTNGTIAHNAIFCNRDAELIILNRFCEEENMHQRAINLIKNIKVTYVNAYHPNVKGNKDDSLMWKTDDFLRFCQERDYRIPREICGRKLYLRILFKLPFLYRFFK